MLDLERTYIANAFDTKVVEGAVISDEGMVLCGVLNPTTGAEEVQPSTGTATDRFAGFSFSHRYPNGIGLECEEFSFSVEEDSPATVQIDLQHTNLTEARITLDGSVVTPEIDATTVAKGKIALDMAKGILTASSEDAGAQITVLYKYEMTVPEQQQKHFEVSPNVGAAEYFGKVAVITPGESRIFTTCYDITADWTTAVPGMGANGIIAPATGDVQAIPNARIIALPSPSSVFLGIAY